MHMSIYWSFSCRKKHLSCITWVTPRIVPQVNAAENSVFSRAHSVSVSPRTFSRLKQHPHLGIVQSFYYRRVLKTEIEE